jgi:hypothetical protein
MFSWGASGQFYIGSGASVHCENNTNDRVVLSLTNTDFISDGDFNAGASDIHFISTDNEDIMVGGPVDFDRIFVETNNSNLIMQSAINANIVNFESGNFDLNSHSIFVFELIEGENNDRSFFGSNGGYVLHRTTLNTPSNVNPGNLGISFTSTENLGEINILRYHTVVDEDGNESLNRRYDLRFSENPTSQNGTIKFSYLEKELNGLPENDLRLWLDDGTGWSLAGTETRNSGENWLEISGNVIQSLNWTAASANFTPVIDLGSNKQLEIGEIYPNPVAVGTQQINLPVSSSSNLDVSLRIVDQLGRQVASQEVQLHNGIDNLPVDVMSLSSGMYFLTVQAENQLISLKLLVQ